MTILMSDIMEIIKEKELLSSFNKKNVLITGCNGLLGSMLVRTFVFANLEYGYNIHIIGQVRNEEKAKAVLGDLVNEITMIYSNDFAFYANCDYIFHTASPTSSKYFIDYPVETIETILLGTKTMLELAKENSAIMVYFSSMEEYGVPYMPGEVMTEDRVGIIDHLTTRSCYSQGKRMCECMCAAYTAEYALATRIVRLAQTFGAGIPITDRRVSMQFARSVVDRRDIVLHTEGKSISNFCYLTDAIKGILTIALKGSNGEAYNVCNDEESRSIREIAQMVADNVAGNKIGVRIEIPQGVNFGYAPDNTMKLSAAKLKSLGWQPSVSMLEGYRRLTRYIEEKEKL